MVSLRDPQPAKAIAFRRMPITELPDSIERIPSGFRVLDTVLGGGLVLGSTVLLAGPEGSGKSTLLLQAAMAMAWTAPFGVLYVSGEESAAHFKERADRMAGYGFISEGLLFLEEQNLDKIVLESQAMSLLIVDSIQAVYDPDPELPAVPGSVRQVAQCAARLVAWGRKTGMPVCLLCQVTKDGTMAGPACIAHLVDAVLYLEPGEREEERVLSVPRKNRFGRAPVEMGLRMTKEGLQEAPEAMIVVPAS